MSEALKWQPIETAPRDGDMVLLWNEFWGYPCIGAIVHPWFQFALLKKHRYAFSRWHPVVPHRFLMNLDFVVQEGVFPLTQEPTHWMPLPPPPEQ